MNPENLDQLLANFNREATGGHGLALTLRRFNDHPDFIAGRSHCGSLEQLMAKDNDEMKQSLADAVTWANIEINNMKNGLMPLTECAEGLMIKLMMIKKKIFSMAHNVGLDEIAIY